MSERALLVMASQHQQPAEVSLGNRLSELVCPDLRAGDGSKRSAIWAVTVAPNEEPERTGDTPIREVTLAESANCCGCSPNTGHNSGH